MKLFQFSDTDETAVPLGEVQYVRKTRWIKRECHTKCPCINVAIKGRQYSLEVCYDEGCWYDRDKDYENLIKELNGDADWERDLPKVRAMLEAAGFK